MIPSTLPPNAESMRLFIDALGSHWPDIREAERARNQRERHHFSPLRSISIKETDHSRLLGGLLDPQGDHGEGPRFLHSFLELIDIEEPARGNWRVTVEMGRVDILLVRKDPLSVVIVENKARGAVDQPGQLYRYWFQEIYRPYHAVDYRAEATKRRFKIIYSPPAEFIQVAPSSLERPAEFAHHAPDHSLLPLSVTYLDFRSKLAPWLAAMADQVEPPRLKAFLHFYSEVWTTP